MVEVFLGREALGDGLPVAASALYGAAWADDSHPIEILVDERRRQPGLVVRMDRVADDEIVTVDGLPVTAPERTAFDLGRYQKRSIAIGRLDALRRAAPFSDDDIAKLMRRYRPVRGVRQLRSLLPLVDVGAESLKESWLRLWLIDNGFPIPETRDIQLAVEYDGDHHRTDRPQYVKDAKHIPGLDRLGWHVIRVLNEDRPAKILRTCTRRGSAASAPRSTKWRHSLALSRPIVGLGKTGMPLRSRA